MQNQSQNPFARMLKAYNRAFGQFATEYYRAQTREGRTPQA